MDCSVIIPVGPGHENLAQIAMQSVQAACEEGMGAFDAVHILLGDDTKGDKGRSATRNGLIYGVDKPSVSDPMAEIKHLPEWAMCMTTAELAKDTDALGSDFLFFLDADDLMCSSRVFGESAFEVVAPYLENYDCIWGTIHEVHKDGQILKRKQVDRIYKYESYVKTPPMLSCQMGHFVRRSVFTGFDETVDHCEDIRWYLHAWKNLRCIKQEKPLFINRRGMHSWLLNAESERPMPTGRDWSIEANKLLKEAREKL